MASEPDNPTQPAASAHPPVPGGSRWAADELLPLVYEELRRLAAARIAREPLRGAGQTLQPTALVHEVYLRLVRAQAATTPAWSSRAHFFAAAAESMRRILVERARERIRHDRMAPRESITLSDAPDTGTGPELDVLGLDEALRDLERLDRRKYDVVMLRFFAGVSVELTAEILAVSDMTVKRDWTFARAWLVSRMSGEAPRPATVSDPHSDPHSDGQP